MTQSINSSTAREASRERRRALSTTGKAALGSVQSNAAQQRVNKTTASVPSSPQVVTASAVIYQGTSKISSGKSASIARRLAMSSRGKAGVVSKDRSRVATDRPPAKVAANAAADKPKGTCGCGCDGKKSACKAGLTKATGTNKSTPAVNNLRRGTIKMSSGRAASFARRDAMSKRGKAGISSNGVSIAQTARAVNPGLSSRELAKILREQRSRQGKCGQKKSEPCGRVRPTAKSKNAAAQDAPWKVGASSTSHGQTLTGTMVGRSLQVTGDEPSTCRDVTGTEYLGAEIFNEFCQSEPAKSTPKVDITTTTHGNAVSGNKIGRGSNVTGNEAGSCKSVTGNEYLAAKESEIYCGSKSQKSPVKVSLVETSQKNVMTGSNVGRSDSVTGDELGSNALLTGSQYIQSSNSATDNVPGKVGNSKTLRGGNVSGSMLDRSDHVTGNEPGSCRNVTGDDYIGQEQFKDFCEKVPQPKDNKVGATATNQGNTVTGVMTSRSQLVTGNEPGTCKSISGTPYTSTDQLATYCEPNEIKSIEARSPVKKSRTAAVISGKQPAVGGSMTGDSKGACEPVSGTPYVGADQLAANCPTQPSDVRSADFPQTFNAAMGNADVRSADFPQTLSAAMGNAEQVIQRPVAADINSVTGSSYEKGNITGPFGMANGKVTGTEQARFGQGKNNVSDVGQALPLDERVEVEVEGRLKSRISGEGMDTTSKITGNDWGRGKNVTGTEGASSIQRNPTLRSNNVLASASPLMSREKRNNDVPVPVSRVTGSSGNTEQGSLVTYSGGARG